MRKYEHKQKHKKIRRVKIGGRRKVGGLDGGEAPNLENMGQEGCGPEGWGQDGCRAEGWEAPKSGVRKGGSLEFDASFP